MKRWCEEILGRKAPPPTVRPRDHERAPVEAGVVARAERDGAGRADVVGGPVEAIAEGSPGGRGSFEGRDDEPDGVPGRRRLRCRRVAGAGLKLAAEVSNDRGQGVVVPEIVRDEQAWSRRADAGRG